MSVSGNNSPCTWESKDTHCEPERLIETYRLQTEALKQELLHQAAASHQQIEEIQASKSKCEKHLIKLENECRRLDYENQLLREEVKGLKLCLKTKTHHTTASAQIVTTSEIVQATVQPEGRKEVWEPCVKELTDVLVELQTQCREQGGKITSCLSSLRKTRQDNEELREIVEVLHKKMRVCDCVSPSNSPLTQSRVEEERGEVVEYSRLFDEMQDVAETGEFADEMMFRMQQDSGSCLLPGPLQHKVSSLETQVSTLQQSLGVTSRHSHRSCGTQTTWDLRPKRTGVRNLTRTSTQKWSLLV